LGLCLGAHEIISALGSVIARTISSSSAKHNTESTMASPGNNAAHPIPNTICWVLTLTPHSGIGMRMPAPMKATYGA